MGALHAGHVSLFRAAREHGDVVMASIFVNPRQFTSRGDLEVYPRTPDADAALAEASGVDCLVRPSLTAMWPAYPEPTATTVSVHGVGDVLEGAQRPGPALGPLARHLRLRGSVVKSIRNVLREGATPAPVGRSIRVR